MEPYEYELQRLDLVSDETGQDAAELGRQCNKQVQGEAVFKNPEQVKQNQRFFWNGHMMVSNSDTDGETEREHET